MSSVFYRLNDGVATIAMDDGKVNIMSQSMLRDMDAAFDRAAADNAAVVVRGRSGAFSAGIDLPVLANGGIAAHTLVHAGFELCARVLAFPAPVVIACSGHAVGLGAFFVQCGDYRIGADGPYKLGASEVEIGMPISHFAVELLRSRLTPTHFNRALINAEMYSPSLAVEAGFLDRVVPQAEVFDAAQHTARHLAQLDRPAFAESKLRVREHTLRALRHSMEEHEAKKRKRA